MDGPIQKGRKKFTHTKIFQKSVQFENPQTHPDLPAVLLKTSTVAETKNYWFPGWSSVKLNPNIIPKKQGIGAT